MDCAASVQAVITGEKKWLSGIDDPERFIAAITPMLPPDFWRCGFCGWLRGHHQRSAAEGCAVPICKPCVSLLNSLHTGEADALTAWRATR